MFCVAPPLTRDVGWDRVSGVQRDHLTGVVPQRTEHRREIGDIALQGEGGERGGGGEGGERER